MRFLKILLASGLLGACTTTIDVADTPPEVTQIGPFSINADQLSVEYAIRDLEGDDARLLVEICAIDCGIAFEGPDSDGTQRVTTAPFDTDVPHIFVWDLNCGMLSGTEVVAVDATTDYRIRITPEGGEPVESSTFRLSDLGLSESFTPVCSRT